MSEQTAQATTTESTENKESAQTAQQPTAAAIPKPSEAVDKTDFENWKRRAEAAESKLKELDSEKTKKEFNELKSRAESAETELRNLRTKDAFSESASKAKAKNPQKLYSLVRERIELGEDGKPKDLSKLIESVKKEFPEEFGAAGTSVDGGAKGKETASASVDDFIRGALG